MVFYYFIDAGVEHFHIQKYNNFEKDSKKLLDLTFKVNDDIKVVLTKNNLWKSLVNKKNKVFVTGKLSSILVEVIGHGYEIISVASLFSFAQKQILNHKYSSVGIIDISASGYNVISIDDNLKLLEDNLITNPRCGAGSGTNLSRILQKLNIPVNKVDSVLKDYVKSKSKRQEVIIRADRCGVFSSSATISDKNQGIPIDTALAITLKSEVLKAVKKISKKVKVVYLTGRIFNWKFARECADDYLSSIGVEKIIFDKEQSLNLDGIKSLINLIGIDNLKEQELEKIAKKQEMIEYPPFKSLHDEYTKQGLYLREKNSSKDTFSKSNLKVPINIGLDIGSTMAKIAICNAKTDKLLYLNSFKNNGDTIETVKFIFSALKQNKLDQLNIQQIGITGSGRYQVEKVLSEVYPHLRDRISVLVENYAHARGSIDEIKSHIKHLNSDNKNQEINTDFTVLIDVGGEDTKISVISLEDNDLYDNAMNIKCSAGTGSLMDTLCALFNIIDINVACMESMNAKRSFVINATCAVFLIENARKLQAQGYLKKEILASCYFAIVENMSRTLWRQISFPENAIAVLHGQTMLSDPLPLAITYRLQKFLGKKTAVYVPTNPGHRACIGLIKSLPKKPLIKDSCDLDSFIKRKFTKKIFICRGVACKDKNSACFRSVLSYKDIDGKDKKILLGGCSAVNEREAKIYSGNQEQSTKKDVYKGVWKIIDDNNPKDDINNKIIIPRSFSISENAFFFSQIFKYFDIPVHVDSVKASDVIDAQPIISIDTCAPLIGAVGQFIRLSTTAVENDDLIFVPQIDFLPTQNSSLGKTCTINQGGLVIAINNAKKVNPQASFFFKDFSLNQKDSNLAKVFTQNLKPIFKKYNKSVSLPAMKKAIDFSLTKERELREQVYDYLCDELEQALKAKKNIVIVCGREYVLNPGIYDSHVGRLFSNNDTIAIPSYIFEGELNHDFSHIYWRNPHFLLTVLTALKDNKLHRLTSHSRLSKLLKKIEHTNKLNIGAVFVSTFRCGPDSMMLHLIEEITREIPFLIIQSDAAINELAHLENRVNTYLKQLNSFNKDNIKHSFDINFLENFSKGKLNKKDDLLFFPTLEDNRMISAVFRNAGFDCIYNYDCDDYNLEKTIKSGRVFSGDLVCAPCSAVFGDSLSAIEKFIELKSQDKYKDKKNVVIFNNKGEGPCRQGQYFETHKLLLYRELNNFINSLDKKVDPKILSGMSVKYIAGHEKNNYDINVEPLVLLQSFQATIMQGILHEILFKGSLVCSNIDEFKVFYTDYQKLKDKVVHDLEHMDLGKFNRFMLSFFSKVPVLNLASVYLFSGIANNNGFRKTLSKFSRKWNYKNKKPTKLKIHVDGEAYMRVAQIEELYKTLIDNIGVNSFSMTYSPIWFYIEYLLELKIIKTRSNNKSGFSKKLEILKLRTIQKLFRSILIRPLYKSAGLSEPAQMEKILKIATKVLPTRKPFGELAPYTGEAIHKLNQEYDLFLNIAPEGCMVSSMGDLLSDAIYKHSKTKKNTARIQSLYSMDGEIDDYKLIISLMKILGPVKFYSKS